MDNVEEGYRTFNCDVCGIWYKYTEVGYTEERIINFQGRYTMGYIYVCNECVEYIGGNYE